MDQGGGVIPYSVLGQIAERMFEECEEDEDKLAQALGELDPEIRDALLVSDFLNAYQVFYYFFRLDPGELGKDRLLLQPASALSGGVIVADVDYFTIVFMVGDSRPQVSVMDEGGPLASFTGSDAYQRAIRVVKENI